MHGNQFFVQLPSWEKASSLQLQASHMLQASRQAGWLNHKLFTFSNQSCLHAIWFFESKQDSFAQPPWQSVWCKTSLRLFACYKLWDHTNWSIGELVSSKVGHRSRWQLVPRWHLAFRLTWSNDLWSSCRTNIGLDCQLVGGNMSLSLTIQFCHFWTQMQRHVMFSCLDNVAPGFLLGPSTFSQLGSDHAWWQKKKHVLVVWPLVSLATKPNFRGHVDYTTVNYYDFD